MLLLEGGPPALSSRNEALVPVSRRGRISKTCDTLSRTIVIQKPPNKTFIYTCLQPRRLDWCPIGASTCSKRVKGILAPLRLRGLPYMSRNMALARCAVCNRANFGDNFFSGSKAEAMSTRALSHFEHRPKLCRRDLPFLFFYIQMKRFLD